MMRVDGEGAGSVGGEDVGLDVVGTVDFGSAVVAELVVEVVASCGVGADGVGGPDDRVDVDLILATADGDAADVKAPAEYPAIVNTPVVANLDVPFAVERASCEFREVVGRHIVVEFVQVV